MAAQSDLEIHRLQPHPAVQSGASCAITASVTRPQPAELRLAYRVEADLTTLRIPEPRPPIRADGLWRHTCFEIFLARAGASEYWEYNFSPSGAWAAYHFTGYREGMAPLLKGAAPQITTRVATDSLEVDVIVDLSWLVRPGAPPELRLGASAVIEDKARELSYFALAHPAEKPDFHHADSFIVTLA